MKKILFILGIIFLVSSSFGQGRYNLDFGVRAGVASYLGDIGSGDLARGFVFNLELKDTRWSGGGFVRYRFHPLFAYQGALTYARIEGSDSKSINYARLGRNLSFKNDLFMLNNKFEFYPPFLTVSDVGSRGRYRTDFKTYFFAGLGVFYHSPTAEYNGTKYKLRPLMTEGQKYSRISLSLPIGSGFYFTHKRQHRFGFEVSWNMTFTDYLDDVSTEYVDQSQMGPDPIAATLANRNPELGSYPQGTYPAPIYYGPLIPGINGSQESLNQRGDPTDKDNFMLISFSYSYVIKTKNGFSRSYSWIYKSKSKFGKNKSRF
jgi:hypothetical protein